MARMCTVCASPKRWEIDQLLVTGASSHREIARRYGFSPSAVDRHAKNDLPAQMATIVQRLDALEGEQILGQLGTLYLKSMEALAAAEADVAAGTAPRSTVLRAISEARKTVESMAKVSFVMTENPAPPSVTRVDIDAAISAALDARRVVHDAEVVDVPDESEGDYVDQDGGDWRAALAALPPGDDDEVYDAEVVGE